MFTRLKKSSNPSGKWQRLPHTGVGSVTSERIGDWVLEVTHRRIGAAVKRDQFSVTIRRESPAYEERLTGFSNKTTALQEARKRIELLTHVRQPITLRGPHIARRQQPPRTH